jgi:hypothetical protein
VKCWRKSDIGETAFNRILQRKPTAIVFDIANEESKLKVGEVLGIIFNGQIEKYVKITNVSFIGNNNKNYSYEGGYVFFKSYMPPEADLSHVLLTVEPTNPVIIDTPNPLEEYGITREYKDFIDKLCLALDITGSPLTGNINKMFEDGIIDKIKFDTLSKEEKINTLGTVASIILGRIRSMQSSAHQINVLTKTLGFKVK